MPTTDCDDIEEFKCPICMELIYKPCVNAACGHVFCFWCFHLAMNGLSKSSCPLCRSSYSHFPKICHQLHSFIESKFSKEYSQRQSEVDEDETQRGVKSPAMDLITGLPSVKDFECVLCKKSPAIQPAFLSCGHLVCSQTCCIQPREEGQGSTRCPACSINVVGFMLHNPWPLTNRLTAHNSCQVPSQKRCQMLTDVIADLFPQQAESQRKATQGGASSSTSMVSTSASQPTQARSKLRGFEEKRAAIDHTQSGLAVWHLGWIEMVKQRDLCFTNFGVGCDCCGTYPIIGRRFKCLNCPEGVGFDLCGPCQDLNPQWTEAATKDGLHGRFNQRHTKEHRMVKIEPLYLLRRGLVAMKSQLAVKEAMDHAGQLSRDRSDVEEELKGLRECIEETELLLVSSIGEFQDQRSEPERVFAVMNVLEALHPEMSIEEITHLAAMDSFVPLDVLREIEEEENAFNAQEEGEDQGEEEEGEGDGVEEEGEGDGEEEEGDVDFERLRL